MPEELWMEVRDIVQEAVIKTIPKKKKYKKAKWLSAEEKEEKLKAKEERKGISIWMQGSKELQGEIRKPSSVDQCKEIEENNKHDGVQVMHAMWQYIWKT